MEDQMTSHEIMKWLDDAALDRFVKFQELFETAGWRLMEEYANAQSNAAILAGANCLTWDENRLHKGARVVWDEIANAHATFMREFALMAADARDESTRDEDLAEIFE